MSHAFKTKPTEGPHASCPASTTTSRRFAAPTHSPRTGSPSRRPTTSTFRRSTALGSAAWSRSPVKHCASGPGSGSRCWAPPGWGRATCFPGSTAGRTGRPLVARGLLRLHAHILADPERLPRYLLKYVVSRLSEGSRGPLHQTPLYRFVDRAIRHSLEREGIKPDRFEDKLREGVEAYRVYFGKTSDHLAAYDVLFQFWRFARPEKAEEPGRRSLALAW